MDLGLKERTASNEPPKKTGQENPAEKIKINLIDFLFIIFNIMCLYKNSSCIRLFFSHEQLKNAGMYLAELFGSHMYVNT